MIRGLFLLVLLAWPAAAESWWSAVLGPYQGPVVNSGKWQVADTSFSLDADGHLVGHYRIADDPPFEGDLTDFSPDGPTSGSFVWHDKFGFGVVHIRFDPEYGRFVGRWGVDAAEPGLVFNGYRIRPPATS